MADGSTSQVSGHGYVHGTLTHTRAPLHNGTDTLLTRAPRPTYESPVATRSARRRTRPQAVAHVPALSQPTSLIRADHRCANREARGTATRCAAAVQIYTRRSCSGGPRPAIPADLPSVPCALPTRAARPPPAPCPASTDVPHRAQRRRRTLDAVDVRPRHTGTPRASSCQPGPLPAQPPPAVTQVGSTAASGRPRATRPPRAWQWQPAKRRTA